MSLRQVIYVIYCIVGTTLATFVHAKTHCVNNEKYSLEYEGTNLTCSQIEEDKDVTRIRACQLDEVRSNCPKACGICCENDPKFKFETTHGIGHKKNCSWIGSKEVRIHLHCNDKNRNGQAVKDACAKACGTCPPYVDDIDFPDYLASVTPAPVAPTTPTPTSSPSPTLAICADKSKFKFRQKYTCLDLKDNEFQRQKFCKLEHVREACPVTCGLCCVDDNRYMFTSHNGKLQSCSLIQSSETRRLRYCDLKELKNACRKTCDNCFERVDLHRTNENSEVDEDDDNSGGSQEIGAGAATSQDTIEKEPRDYTFLILSITCVGVALVLSVSYRIHARQSKQNIVTKEEKLVNVRHFSHDEERTNQRKGEEAPTSEVFIDKTVSAGALTFEVESESLSRKTSTKSLVAASMADLGKKHVSVNNVHKCTNYPCHNCARNRDIVFVKAPRTNVVRYENGDIDFIPVPVDFIGDEKTKDIKNVGTLTQSIGSSGGLRTSPGTVSGSTSLLNSLDTTASF